MGSPAPRTLDLGERPPPIFPHTRRPHRGPHNYFVYLGKAGYSIGVQWLAGSLLLAGVLAQSGGFFVHLGIGRQGRSSAGTALTRSGALLIAGALIMLAIGLILTN